MRAIPPDQAQRSWERDVLAIHVMRRIPVGIAQTGMRRERDSRGSTNVPADRYWGACTQRALKAAPESGDRIPDRFYRCYGYAKHAAMVANELTGLLQPWKREAISFAAGELIEGKLTEHFPLTVGQSGFGRETDCNVNEVLANRSIQLLGGVVGSRSPVHPQKHVNLAQSAASTFATAMHIAIVTDIEVCLVPKAAALAGVIERNAAGGHPGRQSRPGYAYRLRQSLRRIDEAEGDLHEVFAGEALQSAAGETSQKYLDAFAYAIAAATGRPFILAGDMSAEACSADPVIAAMAAIRGLAVVLLGITEDAGRAAGAAVLNRLTSSAAMCLEVIAEDARVIAGSGRQGSARTTPPVIVRSVLNAINILGGACDAMRSAFAGPPTADTNV
jgi:fumarate hydratase class II